MNIEVYEDRLPAEPKGDMWDVELQRVVDDRDTTIEEMVLAERNLNQLLAHLWKNVSGIKKAISLEDLLHYDALPWVNGWVQIQCSSDFFNMDQNKALEILHFIELIAHQYRLDIWLLKGKVFNSELTIRLLKSDPSHAVRG